MEQRAAGPELSADDRRTLESAPIWILTAVAGRQNRFEPEELAAFWRAVDGVAAGEVGLAHVSLLALSDDFSARLQEHADESRSVVTGLWDVTAILARLDPLVSGPFVAALLDVARMLCTARGPYGRSISSEDARTMLLLEALLDIDPATSGFARDAFA
ncbi:hypothetical protein ACVBEQ_13635 [Nakamurella sp. GG22]